MKKNVQKMTSLVLAAIMAASLMACGKQQESSVKTEESKASTDSSSEVKASEDSNAADEAGDELGYPIVEEPVTLRVMVAKHRATEDYDQLEVFQKLEEKTGVHIEWEYVGSDWGTQKNLILAGGDMPDIFWGLNVLSEADVISNAPLFLEMTDYIEKYCPNIKKMMEENKTMDRFAYADDGNIYGLPSQMGSRPRSLDMMMINQKWLDNLGLKTPTTTEEFEAVLKAFKEQDANGNGDPNDEIPLSFMGFEDLTGCLSLYGAFGSEAVDSLNGTYLGVEAGNVVFTPVTEGFKEGTKWLQSLYQQELIDQEVFSHTWSTYPARLEPEGESIVGVAFHWNTYSAFGGERREEYVGLNALKGPEGDQYWRYNDESTKARKYFGMVSASCEYPEVAMRWLDAIYDEQVSMELFYGPIGTKLEDNGDGTYTALPAPEGVSADQWNRTQTLDDNFGGYVSDETSAKIILGEDSMYKLEIDGQYAQYFKDEFYPVVTLTEDQNAELSTLKTDLRNYFKETVSSWIVHGGDIDAEWDAYVEAMKKMGSDRYTEIYQEAYDANMK